MTVTVAFKYDEQAAKWEVLVTGASDEVEARQAFAAVVATCRETNGQSISTQTPEGVAITPAV